MSIDTTRKPSTALQWFAHNAATESAIIDMANSRQIALRARLRNHYWLTDCKPIGDTTIALTRRKMALIDQKDAMTEPDVLEVLTDHYGFRGTSEGWTIPDLQEARRVAVGAAQGRQDRASLGGQAKAAKAAQGRGMPEASKNDEDF